MTASADIAMPAGSDLLQLAEKAATSCGVDLEAHRGDVARHTPITGTPLVPLAHATAGDADDAIERAHRAFPAWRDTPAPQRGQLISTFGVLLREHREELATLVSVEAGKVTSEALGEVQEMIDICDFAVGLSRQLYGRTMPSERPGHRLMETWHPIGVVGVISAFNFPVAVWSWNTAVALVCGDPVIWKPSDQTPLCALAANALLHRAIAAHGEDPDIAQVLVGGAEVGTVLVEHPKVALLSATGSTRMGRDVGPRVAARFGSSLLELGGNNAAIVAPSADLDLATRGVVFAAAGTAGQRCTTMRRAIVHRSHVDDFVDRLASVYDRLPIGDPLQDGTLVGPLAGAAAYEGFVRAIKDATADGGAVVAGGSRVEIAEYDEAYYVQPTIIRMPKQTSVVERETFAPILYVLTYDTLDEAIALNNAVPQGLSSSIFTQDQAEAERFMSASGSDCGIVNVNIGTSGAEIGGAFGGEKETGGGRESGSDAWRAYMRRATNTINYSGELPLAQGVNFDV